MSQDLEAFLFRAISPHRSLVLWNELNFKDTGGDRQRRMQTVPTRGKVEAEPPNRQRRVGNRDHRSLSYCRNQSSGEACSDRWGLSWRSARALIQ